MASLIGATAWQLSYEVGGSTAGAFEVWCEGSCARVNLVHTPVRAEDMGMQLQGYMVKEVPQTLEVLPEEVEDLLVAAEKVYAEVNALGDIRLPIKGVATLKMTADGEERCIQWGKWSIDADDEEQASAAAAIRTFEDTLSSRFRAKDQR